MDGLRVSDKWNYLCRVLVKNLAAVAVLSGICVTLGSKCHESSFPVPRSPFSVIVMGWSRVILALLAELSVAGWAMLSF